MTLIPGKTGIGKTNAGTPRTAAGRATSGRKDTRLKATYVKPHTSDDKKPFISKMSAGLDAIGKGIPAGVKPDYDAGDRVLHVKYGEGTVICVEKAPKDYKVTVRFDEAGQKIMYAAFARLKKL